MKPTKPRKRPSERVSFPTSYGAVSFIPNSFKKQNAQKVAEAYKETDTALEVLIDGGDRGEAGEAYPERGVIS
jgi:hypothetical protein